MKKGRKRKKKRSDGKQARELRTQGEALIAQARAIRASLERLIIQSRACEHQETQARAIRALLERLIVQGDEHRKRMIQFKEGRDLNRAEAAGDLILGTLLYRVCGEGEMLIKLRERLRPSPRGART
ncbi:MAG: hypothetical protein RL681_609 [Candidatus Parcubacteria bacterium]|jgi:hypothetical protein